MPGLQHSSFFMLGDSPSTLSLTSVLAFCKASFCCIRDCRSAPLKRPHLAQPLKQGCQSAASVPMATPEDSSPARELFKRFEVQKVLGKGSYGTVYKVKRLSDKQIYAMKEANVERMTPLERQDAINEIRLLASIHHTNICTYHEAFLDGNKLCIVMEFVGNGDLARFIKKGTELKKLFPEEILWKYFNGICQGLQHMHNSRILHRDIKPANVFVGEHDIVKLGDLGVAKLMKDGQAKTQIGTPHYMAPEIWLNKPYSYGSDMWALGCLLYELMTYRVPFEAKSLAELRTKVLTAKIKPVTPGKYSPELIDLVNSLLQQNPAKRPDLTTILAQPHMRTFQPKGKDDKANKADVFKTIQIPSDLRMLDERLPPPSYAPAPKGGPLQAPATEEGLIAAVHKAAPSRVSEGAPRGLPDVRNLNIH